MRCLQHRMNWVERFCRVETMENQFCQRIVWEQGVNKYHIGIHSPMKSEYSYCIISSTNCRIDNCGNLATNASARDNEGNSSGYVLYREKVNDYNSIQYYYGILRSDQQKTYSRTSALVLFKLIV